MNYSSASNTYNQLGRTEALNLISASNVDGSVVVTVIGESIQCSVIVGSLADAASLLSAASANTTFECYTRQQVVQEGSRILVQTREIRIVRIRE